ncbi:hypothetical protein HaLaN_10435 [Haematococcus lacustris]|uniref:Uncharacterized protein n=1 Tax=Haematococcus lacustris TaxID=44745 RepID=A0A699YXQ5_HAELA|nr:hypothetical protein HaLaN_10435 [Haematococcus lacustris]
MPLVATTGPAQTEALVRDKGAALGTTGSGWAWHSCRVGGRQSYYMRESDIPNEVRSCKLITTKATMTAIAPVFPLRLRCAVMSWCTPDALAPLQTLSMLFLACSTHHYEPTAQVAATPSSREE